MRHLIVWRYSVQSTSSAVSKSMYEPPAGIRTARRQSIVAELDRTMGGATLPSVECLATVIPTAQPRVAIVGAGPAGTSFALHALARGVDPADLVLYDRAVFPRPKLCGGALTTRGTELLAELGFVPGGRMETTQLRFQSRLGAFCVRERGPQWLYDRSHLDAQMIARVREAGVQVRQDEAVRALSVDAQSVTLQTSKGQPSYEWVVGADGARGVVARGAGLGGGIVGRLVEAVYEPTDPGSGSDELLFDFDPVLDGIPGYAWSFPYPKPRVPGEAASEVLGGHYKIGIMDGRGITSGALLRGWTEAFAARNGFRRVDAKLSGWPEHYYSHRTRAHAPGVLLTGEAWGIDPLLGEGIAPALELSRYAAGRLKEALDNGSRSLSHYERDFQSTEPGRNLRFHERLANLLYGNNPQRWLRVLFQHQYMRELAEGGTEAYGRLEKHSWKLARSYAWQVMTGR